MTRTYFDENITTWSELLDFCDENDIYICDDIMSKSDRDEEVNNGLPELARRQDWMSVWEILNGISTGYDYYRKDGDFDYAPMDDYLDFEDYKEETANYCDNTNFWDPEYDEDEDEDEECEELIEEDEENDEPVDEPFAIGELYTVCSGVLKSINAKSAEAEKEAKLVFDEFASNFVVNEIRKGDYGVK